MTGSELSEIREWCGLNNNQFAQYCGISRTSLWRMETDKQPINIDVEKKIRSLDPNNQEFRKWLNELPMKQRFKIIKRMSRTDVIIYALKDPRDGSVRYVGRTFHVAKRYRNHLSSKKTSPKGLWIEELKQCGLRPKIEILETVDRKYMLEAEIEWISSYSKSRKSKLFNSEKRRV